jgi:hypothetical protein
MGAAESGTCEYRSLAQLGEGSTALSATQLTRGLVSGGAAPHLFVPTGSLQHCSALALDERSS